MIQQGKPPGDGVDFIFAQRLQSGGEPVGGAVAHLREVPLELLGCRDIDDPAVAVGTAGYPLDVDASYTITGANGGTNLLVIEDGAARIEEASCPDGVCVHTGRIRRNGQSIVCLPNQAVVEIVSDTENSSGVDITAG